MGLGVFEISDGKLFERDTGNGGCETVRAPHDLRSHYREGLPGLRHRGPHDPPSPATVYAKRNPVANATGNGSAGEHIPINPASLSGTERPGFSGGSLADFLFLLPLCGPEGGHAWQGHFEELGPYIVLERSLKKARRIGEAPTQVNHVGLIVEGGPISDAVIVESLSRTLRRKLVDGYNGKNAPDVAVFRPIDITPEEVAIIVAKAEDYVGRTYGYFKVLTCLADWFLFEKYVFRRLSRTDNFPMCSWLVAHAEAKVNRFFGVDPGAATPDDIWDFCVAHPEKYALVIPLGNLDTFRRLEPCHSSRFLGRLPAFSLPGIG